jgi:hypothetical protein
MVITVTRFREILAEEGMPQERIEEICANTGGLPLGMFIAMMGDEQTIRAHSRWFVQEFEK